jgi:hypothetical protein
MVVTKALAHIGFRVLNDDVFFGKVKDLNLSCESSSCSIRSRSRLRRARRSLGERHSRQRSALHVGTCAMRLRQC